MWLQVSVRHFASAVGRVTRSADTGHPAAIASSSAHERRFRYPAHRAADPARRRAGELRRAGRRRSRRARRRCGGAWPGAGGRRGGAAPAMPAAALALRDGFAVRSEPSLDASSYAPVPLSPRRAVSMSASRCRQEPTRSRRSMRWRCATDRSRRSRRSRPAKACWRRTPTLPRGTAPAGPGARCALIDRGAPAAFGIARVPVRAAAGASSCGAAADDAVHRWRGRRRSIAVADVGAGSGAAVRDMTTRAALTDDSADAVIAIGGTGSGRNDASVRTLARVGRVEVHGIAHHAGRDRGLRHRRTRPGAAAAGPARCRARRSGSRSAAHAGAARLSGVIEEPAVRRRAHAQGRLAARARRSRPGARRRRRSRAHSLGLFAARGAGARRRLDPGAGRQRRISGRRARSW